MWAMVRAWSGLHNRHVRPSTKHGHRGPSAPRALPSRRSRCRSNNRSTPDPGNAAGVRRTKGCAVAAQPSGKAATTYPSYLHTAEVADLLHVSPKTVARWAKEGKLPYLKTLGGHRRYPEAEIRELASELREEATA